MEELAAAYDTDEVFPDDETKAAINALVAEVVSHVMSSASEDDLLGALHKVGTICYLLGSYTDDDETDVQMVIPRQDIGSLVKALLDGDDVSVRLTTR